MSEEILNNQWPWIKIIQYEEKTNKLPKHVHIGGLLGLKYNNKILLNVYLHLLVLSSYQMSEETCNL